MRRHCHLIEKDERVYASSCFSPEAARGDSHFVALSGTEIDGGKGGKDEGGGGGEEEDAALL